MKRKRLKHDYEDKESPVIKLLKLGKRFVTLPTLLFSFPCLLDSPKVVDLQKESWNGIKTVFCKLVTSISESLQERHIQPKQLVGCLVGWFDESKILKEEEETLFRQVKKLCEESKSFIDFWSIILDYISFYSYKFLKAIANSKFATKEDKEKFEEYEEHFLRYSTEVVAKYASSIDFSIRDGVTEVIVKIKSKV